MKVGVQPTIRCKYTVWVEDALTQTVLDTLWLDPDIGVAVAHGRAYVHAVVKNAPDAGRAVFGYVDRDTRPAKTWKKNTKVFQSQRHEIENYLLDFDLLADVASRLGCARASVVELESAARDRADALGWWLAVKRVVAAWDVALTEGMPKGDAPKPPKGVKDRADAPKPSKGVKDRAAALRHLKARGWVEKAANGFEGRFDGAQVAQALDDAYEEADGWLRSGDWLTHFPGKDLFAAVWERFTPIHPLGSAHLAQTLVEEMRLRRSPLAAELLRLRDLITGR